jgi:hypothetical protein
MPDSAIIAQNEFEEAMKGITVQQKWAKDQKFDKTSALLKVKAFIKNLLQPIGVFSLIDSVTVNGVDWPLVTIPFYSNPVAIPIVIGDGFGANSRNTERTRCEESAMRLDLLDSAVKGLIWQTIKSNGDEKESMMNYLHGKDQTAWDLMQAIQLCLTEAEGTADSIRAKCQTMAGVDFKDTVWLVSKIKSMFEELFLKYQRLTRTGFTNTEKVKFLTTLYERNPHEEILQLNRSLKNAIQIGTLKTWNEVCDLFEEKEKELIADAEKFKQMKQALQLHEKKTLDHSVMYLPGANSTSHALNTAQQRTNDPKSVANSTMSTANPANGTRFSVQ